MKQASIDFLGPFTFDPHGLTIAPSVHPQARETSALAAVGNLPQRASQNARLLALIRAAGETGISDLELHRATGFPRATICARRGWDLKTLIQPAGRHQDATTKQFYTRWKVKTA